MPNRDQSDQFREQVNNSRSVHRRDIDGLRAVAILSVVAYHAFPSAFTGGFVGVDVFFVISGFLISTIIVEGLCRGEFSLPKFYGRRVRRIFPGLILVMGATFALGWVALLPDEFKQLGRHMAASTVFLENFQLNNETGYFDVETSLKPLMHLWSLAIEEQFYLIWPLLLWGLWRATRHMALMLILILAISFTLNMIEIGTDPATAFLMPETRFWELLAGSLLAYFHLFKQKEISEWLSPVANVFSLAGLALIASAVFFLQDADRFPGWRALLPVLGSVLVLLSGSTAWINRNVLASRVPVFIGLISYPLYLWHWPLLSYATILESETPSRGLRTGAVALSFALAWLTYRAIEKPIRFNKRGKLVTASLCVCTGILGCVGWAVYAANGVGDRTVVKLNAKMSSGTLNESRDYLVNTCGIQDSSVAERFPYCESDSRGGVRFALLGDSKAAALAPGVFKESTEKGRWLFIGGPGPSFAPVYPVVATHAAFSHYPYVFNLAVDAISRNDAIQAVVITSATRLLFGLKSQENIEELPFNKNFAAAFSSLSNVVAEFARAHKKVVFTIDNPSFKDPRFCIGRITSIGVFNSLLGLGEDQACFISLDRQLSLSRQYRRLLADVQAKFPEDVRVFDTLDQLCEMTARVCSAFSAGRLLYSHSDHISEYASVRIAERLVPYVERFADGDDPVRVRSPSALLAEAGEGALGAYAGK